MLKCALCWEATPKTGMMQGTAWGVTGNICKDCVSYVGNENFQSSLQPMTKPYTYPYGYDMWDDDLAYGGYDTVYPVKSTLPMCKHHLDPFTFQGIDDVYTVYLTGHLHIREKAQGPGPDVGVYLDDAWLDGRLATNDGVVLDVTPDIPTALYVGWRDYGVIESRVLNEAITWVQPYLHKKENIEIACLGGHGRTGTYLAALMMSEGWTLKGAVDEIRDKYCNRAVESPSQMDLLEGYDKSLEDVYAARD